MAKTIAKRCKDTIYMILYKVDFDQKSRVS